MTTWGAIRWDVGGYGNMQFIDEPENNTLRNPDFHSRAPFYATPHTANSLDIVATQDTMDQEIAFANVLEVNYWAIMRYRDYQSHSRPVDDPALVLYQASTARGPLKWASIEQFGTFGKSSDYAGKIGRLVTEMAQSHYQKVLGNRPLLFLYYSESALATYFTNLAGAKAALDAIRAAAISAGLGTPYIAVMLSTHSGSAGILSGLGADAATQYSAYTPIVRNPSYATLRASTAAGWENFRTAAGKIIPTAMSGWNKAPRRARPPFRGIVPGGVGSAGDVTLATDSEIAAHMVEAKAYVQAHPTECDADTFIAYSWNEFSEGGRTLCPTLGNAGSHLSIIADAMAA